MKKIVMFICSLLLIGTNLYAAQGDLIVKGRVFLDDGYGIGSVSDSSVAPGFHRGMWIPSNSSYGSVNFVAHSWGHAPHFVFRNTYDMAPWMVITNSNVGIGTASPLSKLHLANGDHSNGSSYKTQVAFGYNGTNQYSHWLVTRHNAGTTSNNAIDFYTSDGTANGVFPTNAVLGLSIGAGGVGMGGYLAPTPGFFRLVLNGNAYASGGAWYASDSKLKKNIQPINDSLNKVLNLKGVSYEWRKDEYKDKHFDEGRHYGVIAQEIETILPDVVKEGPDGDKAVAYTELIPVLIEAIKEQQAQIEQQQNDIEQLKKLLIAEKK